MLFSLIWEILLPLFIIFTATNASFFKYDNCLESKTSTPTCIVTNSLPLVDGKNLNYRAMPSIGNGYLGTVIMSDEIHISGVFNGRANVTPDNDVDKDRHKHTHRARIPSPVAINYTNPAKPNENRTYFLDILNGVFIQSVESAGYVIKQQSYAHRSLKHVLVTEITVESDLVVEFDVISNMGRKSSDINFKDIPTPYKYNIMFGYINETETRDSQNVSVAVVYTKLPRQTCVFGVFTKAYITAVATSLDSPNPIKSAIQYYQQAYDMYRTNTLYDTHSEAWKQIWSHGNITITNNLFLLQTVYSSLYYILSSVREDWKYGLSPGSLPMGYEYLGHSFWDQETWMYPPILMFYPEMAKSLLDYRFERLEAAQEIARQYRFKGAMYPWESALSGFEVCPEEVYGRKEIHITGDIAFAVHQYYLTTLDIDWMRSRGFNIIYQSALFWESRVTLNKTTGLYHINNVMPPDEYHYPVNDSVYTNVIAQKNLRLAVKYSKIVGIKVPQQWQLIADNIYIPLDKTLDYHPEYTGFNITDPKSVVKQADTILINYPLMFEMDKSSRKNDLQFYKKITDPNGPAMTHSMFSIGWNEVGNWDFANKAFEKNFENIQEPFHVWSEIKGGKGASNFITAAGGYLQAVIFGFGGLRIKEDGLYFDIHRMPKNENYCLRGIKYQGNAYLFCREHSQCNVEVIGFENTNLLTHLVKFENQIDEYKKCTGYIQSKSKSKN